ncbi:MAG TPA: ROK family protein [Candidatus Saccharimonadales bacterium]|nr:ROK family protein [Candidatus Saccharimonadales bacterium]
MSAQRATPTDEDPIVPAATARLTGRALGIDIGGTGIKAAVVDLATGKLLTDRIREATPQPATPEAVVKVVADVVRQLEATGMLTASTPGGAGFPSVIRGGRAMTATNLDSAWIGAPVQQLLEDRLGRPMLVLNDADAAGVAEVAHGAGKGQPGVVLVLTIGTGIGSALFIDGQLVPNLQLGHLEFHGKEAESRLSGAARLRRKIGWKKWAREFDDLLGYLEKYLWPDLIILGGGVSKELPKYQKHLRTSTPLVAAAMLNTSGIVGAAMAGGNAARVPRPASGESSPRRRRSVERPSR